MKRSSYYRRIVLGIVIPFSPLAAGLVYLLFSDLSQTRFFITLFGLVPLFIICWAVSMWVLMRSQAAFYDTNEPIPAYRCRYKTPEELYEALRQAGWPEDYEISAGSDQFHATRYFFYRPASRWRTPEMLAFTEIYNPQQDVTFLGHVTSTDNAARHQLGKRDLFGLHEECIITHIFLMNCEHRYFENYATEIQQGYGPTHAGPLAANITADLFDFLSRDVNGHAVFRLDTGEVFTSEGSLKDFEQVLGLEPVRKK